MKHFQILLWIFFFANCTPPSLSTFTPNLEIRPDQDVEAQHGVVAAAHPLASEAGLKILQLGGNAVDAAVATSFAISVLRPQSTGIGGGGFLLLYRKEEEKVHVLDFRERAPAAASVNMYVNADGSIKSYNYAGKAVGPASSDGPLSVGIPGLIAGLIEVHKKYGTLPLHTIMAPAIAIAENGFEVYPHLAKSIERRKHVLETSELSRKIFLPNGRPLGAGEKLLQPELAHTLRKISKIGADYFYNGVFAKELVAEMKHTHGIITHKDLKNYRVKTHEALEGSYHGYRIVSMPPPSSGGIHIIQILNMLENDALAKLGHSSVAYLHLLSEAMRRAFADRAKYLGDMEFYKVPLKGLLSKNYAQQLRQSIDLSKATPSKDLQTVEPSSYESPSTTHISVVDRWGNAISTTQTINGTFGSGITVAGVVLNNEMDDFSAKAGNPNIFGLVGNGANAVAAGKTMLSSMSPTLVFDSQKNLRWILGSPGGPLIISSTLQTIINLIDFHMPLVEAVNAPRIHHQWIPDSIAMEQGKLAPESIRQLEKMGHSLHVPDVLSFGDVQAIGRTADGKWEGVSDHRSDGRPSGY